MFQKQNAQFRSKTQIKQNLCVKIQMHISDRAVFLSKETLTFFVGRIKISDANPKRKIFYLREVSL